MTERNLITVVCTIHDQLELERPLCIIDSSTTCNMRIEAFPSDTPCVLRSIPIPSLYNMHIDEALPYHPEQHIVEAFQDPIQHISTVY